MLYYNARQYGAIYHLLETSARYDSPEIFGKTGLRKYETSSYSSKQAVKAAFADLISKARAKYIFLSYNNEGLLDLNDIQEILSQKGTYSAFTQDYARFKADSSRIYKTSKTKEYLHICKPA